MSILSDKEIVKRAENGMITPFEGKQVNEVRNEKVISYGTSSYGYDFRIINEFKVFTNINNTIIDPKDFDENNFQSVQTNVCIIPPNSFVLARTLEWFEIPRDILTFCLGKSTYARSGIIINVTPFEPEWKGYATIEISNTTPNPCKIYAYEGIGQLIFFRADEVCKVSYADKKGKYQLQKEIVLSKV